MQLTLGVCATLMAVGASTALYAQAPGAQPRLVGQSLGGRLVIDGSTKAITQIATLTFIRSDTAPIYTVEFVARYHGDEPVAAPGVVDMVVTEKPSADEQPEMTLEVDGRAGPLVARLKSSRSIVTSMTLDDFMALTRAERIVERSFGAELEFSPPQMRMLRTIAERWSGQPR